MTEDRFVIDRRLYDAEAGLKYSLARFGDELAKREGYGENTGMDAVFFYVCHRFSWPPSQVRGMTSADLQFLLSEEMHGWAIPKAARID